MGEVMDGDISPVPETRAARRARRAAAATAVVDSERPRRRRAAAAKDTPAPEDARNAPSPAGGWSETIVTVPKALIVPTSGKGTVQAGGVFDADRAFVPQAVHWRRGRPLLEPIRPRRLPAKPDEVLPGRWMWGGLLLNHFGHFLTESTPRLWALPDLAGKIDGLVFLHKRNAEVIRLHTAFLAMLGCDLPIRVIDRPTEVEELHIPGQGFGLGRITLGTPRFRDLFRDRFARDIAAEGPERLYISRSALGPKRGGVIGEPMIEEHLARHGYEVFHPQHHPIEVQVARYRAAKEIIALDGSALHLAAFCASEGQRVAMIRRRNSSVSNTIVLHLASFTGNRPAVIDAILADWVLKDKGTADRFSMGELDMPALQLGLQAAGFIGDEGAVWPALDDDWRDTQITRLREEYRKDYIRLPRGGQPVTQGGEPA